jgi:CRISPR system Cascade subunit CasE
MHRTICKSFPDANFKGNEPSGILFRVDLHPRTHIPTLLVQSRQKPTWDVSLAEKRDYLLEGNDLPLSVENPAVKEMSLRLHEGQMLAFRLRANPTFKKTTVKENGEKHKARLGVFKEEDQRKWLANKFKLAGAELVSVNVVNDQFVHGKVFIEREKEKRMKFLSVQFDGLLKVKDPDELVKTIYSGFGSAKGLGFGLLSLARVQ